MPVLKELAKEDMQNETPNRKPSELERAYKSILKTDDEQFNLNDIQEDLTEAAMSKRYPKASDVLGKASDHIKSREAEYDRANGEMSMDRAVKAFNAIHGTHLTTSQGWHFMQLVKNSRFFAKEQFHPDSGEDGVGYAALMVEARAKET